MRELDVAMTIARDDKENYLAMRKNTDRNSKDRYLENPWETPGGKLKDDETPPMAAIRELGEEALISGLYVGPEDYKKEEYLIEHIQKTEDGSNEVKINFYPVPIRVRGVEPEITLSEEHDEYSWLSYEEFEEELPEHNFQGLKTVREDF